MHDGVMKTQENPRKKYPIHFWAFLSISGHFWAFLGILGHFGEFWGILFFCIFGSFKRKPSDELYIQKACLRDWLHFIPLLTPGPTVGPSHGRPVPRPVRGELLVLLVCGPRAAPSVSLPTVWSSRGSAAVNLCWFYSPPMYFIYRVGRAGWDFIF